MIKKLFVITVFSVLLVLGFVGNVGAVDVVDPVCSNVSGGDVPAVCVDNQNTQGASEGLIFGPGGVGSTIVNVLSFIVGIAAVIVIMIAGIRLITSSGDPNSVTAARNAIIGAVVGLVVVALSQLVVKYVLSRI